MANLLLVCTEPALCEGDAARSLPPAAAKLAWPAAPGVAALRAKYAVLAALLVRVRVRARARPSPSPSPSPSPCRSQCGS